MLVMISGIDVSRGRMGRYEFNFATDDGHLTGVVEVSPYGLTLAELDGLAVRKIRDPISIMVSVAQMKKEELLKTMARRQLV